jgi:hypothetical protein
MKWHARVVGQTDLPPEDQRLVLDHVKLSGQDYSNRELWQLCVIGSRLENCRFDGLRVPKSYASFGEGTEQSEYINCSFDGAKIYITSGYARFVNCSFRNVDLRDWRCLTTELVDCTFSGTLRTAIFHGRVPEDKLVVLGREIDHRKTLGREVNEFRGNDFEAMDLIDVSFRTGIDLTQQRLPTGPQYVYLPDAAKSLTRVRSELAEWDGSPESRQAALRMVNRWLEEDVIRDGQRQLFRREKDLYGIPGIPRDAVDKVFALLRSE